MPSSGHAGSAGAAVCAAGLERVNSWRRREQLGAHPAQRRHTDPRTLLQGGLAAPLGGGADGSEPEPEPEARGVKLSQLGEHGLIAELERRGLACGIENDAAELDGGLVV